MRVLLHFMQQYVRLLPTALHTVNPYYSLGQ